MAYTWLGDRYLFGPGGGAERQGLRRVCEPAPAVRVGVVCGAVISEVLSGGTRTVRGAPGVTTGLLGEAAHDQHLLAGPHRRRPGTRSSGDAAIGAHSDDSSDLPDVGATSQVENVPTGLAAVVPEWATSVALTRAVPFRSKLTVESVVAAIAEVWSTNVSCREVASVRSCQLTGAVRLRAGLLVVTKAIGPSPR